MAGRVWPTLEREENSHTAVNGVNPADDGAHTRFVHAHAVGVAEEVLVRARTAPFHHLVYAARVAPVVYEGQDQLPKAQMEPSMPRHNHLA